MELQQPTTNNQQPTTHLAYKMSWTAYVRPLIIFLILALVSSPLFQASTLFGSIYLVLIVAFFAYQILTIRSLYLYTDDDGVWVYSGILPWSKGISGVKWRDLEDAVYFPNFLSWLLKSYTVRVGHRFTKTSEIVLPHIAHGHEAVVYINDLHRMTLSKDV
jgi:hypothetical protein